MFRGFFGTAQSTGQIGTDGDLELSRLVEVVHVVEGSHFVHCDRRHIQVTCHRLDDFGLEDLYTYDSEYRVVRTAFDRGGVEGAVTRDALGAYQSELHADISALVLRNREAGPVGILGVVDERCGGVFDDIDDVIPRAEIESFMSRYKSAAGFAIDALNRAPRTIPAGARVRG